VVLSPLPRDRRSRAVRATTVHPTDGPSAGSGLSVEYVNERTYCYHQAQINEYKCDMERLARELQDVKRSYYEEKRRETLQRERDRRSR